MILFTAIAALLLAIALMFVLPTLLRKDLGASQHVLREELNLSVLRDQMRELDADLAAATINRTAYESAKQELERRVAEDVQPVTVTKELVRGKLWTGILIGLTIPVLVIPLYLLLGSPSVFDSTQASGIQAQDQAHAVSEEQIVSMVAGLEKKLKGKPDDPDGWVMLARSYHAMGKFRESADAYAIAVKLMPDNGDLLADYADTLAMAQNRSLQGTPEQLLARALAVDPNNIKALALAGSAAFDRRDFQGAVSHWKKILLLVPPESETARSTISNIDEAQGLAGESVTMPASPVAVPAVNQASVRNTKLITVEGIVELDMALRSKVADTDTVFIFARAVNGPKFPLAVIRKQVRDLPINFVLDDAMSMMPNAKLSNFPMVIVGARISKSGNATPNAGDFEGATEQVRPGATGLKIWINSEKK